MFALTLTALFTLSAFAALGAMAVTWQQHGAAALQAAGQAAACPETVTVRFVVREVQVPRSRANVVTLPVRPAIKPAARLAPQPPLRAAA